MAKQNFDYDKVYTAGWKDAMEEMEAKLVEEQKISNQMQTMVLLLLEKIKEMEVKLNKL
jgi:uncharacterized coiled-coil protein SlyX